MANELVQGVCDWSRRLRAARAYAGLSQAAVAELLDVSATTLKRWEHLAEPPNAAKRAGVERRMIDAAGCPAWLFGQADLPVFNEVVDSATLTKALATLVTALGATGADVPLNASRVGDFGGQLSA